MALPRPADVPSDLLEEFRLDTAEHLPRCEQLLIELESHPQDGSRLRELFRLVHTIKGSLGYVELNHLLPWKTCSTACARAACSSTACSATSCC